MSQKVKRTLIIIASSVLAVICAIIIVFIIVKSTSRTVGYVTSSEQSVIPSSEPVDLPVSSVEEPTDNGIKLIISSPNTKNYSTTDNKVTFTGTSDPAEPLTVNGATIERGTDGIFSIEKELSVGKNVFTFVHKGETISYTINYRYVIIKSFSPSGSQKYPSGSTVIVNASARKGSIVKASFNGKTIQLAPSNNDTQDSEFIGYNGGFTLPNDNYTDLNLKKIAFTATHDGKSESFYSGNIICLKNDIVVDYDPNATPLGGKYINVGSGYVAEIVEYNAETFDGVVKKFDDSIDWSRPTNNYLPKGTVDYCATNFVTYKDLKYVTLRSGYRVYLDRVNKPYKDVKPVVKQYIFKLPDHNEIKANEPVTEGNQTVLKFDCLWKAPFYFDLRDQSYNNPSAQDYTISSVTYNYVDITFCYATVFDGEITIPEDNPLFKSAEIIKNKNDYTLRLFLKKQGGFYGWDSYYNDQGQLCFNFLNPKSIIKADNAYGVNLNGAKILIDVGHGGIDIGAPGFDYKNHSEAIQNLFLANKLKAELQSIGADVILTRTDNSTSSSDDKITLLKRLNPDYCICIHHNSSTNKNANGFGAYHFNAFSKKPAEFVFLQTSNTGIYKSSSLQWHMYFVARTTNCPVVLTESGFMSNDFDYNNIISSAVNIQKAKAMTRGIVDYFNYINK